MIARSHTAIFSTNEGAIAVTGDVKLRILELLRTGPVSFDKIVHQTGKAKSTISVHLNDLQNSNLLREHVDPADRRKKSYSLCSTYLACSRAPLGSHYMETLDRFSNSFEDEFEFLKYVFRAVRCGFDARGINNRPFMKLVGKDIGNHISVAFDFADICDVFEEMRSYWGSHRLGRMYIEDTDPLTIRVKDCFECESLPVTGEPVCSFDEGVLEGIMKQTVGLNIPFREIECYAAGDDHCLFVPEPVTRLP